MAEVIKLHKRMILVFCLIAILMVSVNVHAQKISLPSWKDAIKVVKKGDWFYYKVHSETFNPFMNKTSIKDYYTNITILDKTKDMIKVLFVETDRVCWYSEYNYTLGFPFFYPNNATAYYGGDIPIKTNVSYFFKDYYIKDNFLIVDFRYLLNMTFFLPTNKSTIIFIDYNVTFTVNALHSVFVVNMTRQGTLKRYDTISNNLRICEEPNQELKDKVALCDTNLPILEPIDEGEEIEVGLEFIYMVAIVAVITVAVLCLRRLKKEEKAYEGAVT